MNRAVPLLLLALALASATAAFADNPSLKREDQLKAAYVFNFAKFVEWPASLSPNVLTVCFIGSPSVQAAFASNHDKIVGTRRVSSRALASSDDGADCAIVYLASSGDEPTPIPAPATGALTISDGTDFIRRGGIIEIFSEGNRLRFNINQENAKRAGLKISSNLLRLASRVD
jgi:hypothetical protein